MKVVTYENGFDARKKNLYKDWLVPMYRLAIETGGRREELVTIQWSDIVNLDNSNKLIFRVDNLKVVNPR